MKRYQIWGITTLALALLIYVLSVIMQWPTIIHDEMTMYTIKTIIYLITLIVIWLMTKLPHTKFYRNALECDNYKRISYLNHVRILSITSLINVSTLLYIFSAEVDFAFIILICLFTLPFVWVVPEQK